MLCYGGLAGSRLKFLVVPSKEGSGLGVGEIYNRSGVGRSRSKDVVVSEFPCQPDCVRYQVEARF